MYIYIYISSLIVSITNKVLQIINYLVINPFKIIKEQLKTYNSLNHLYD